MRRRFLISLALAGAAQSVWADDVDALMLADSAPETVATRRDWQAYAEVAFGESIARVGGAVSPNQRLSFDLQLDKSLAPGWRAVLADRWDVTWPAQGRDSSGINTLKEAYLSWQVQDERLLDLGRINARYGVATGYNPTDFLRSGALRSLVSVDPGSLKKNRMGSVMLRGQTLWSGGSFTALYSPKLEDQPSSSAFSADLGATNKQQRWLLALSQQWTDKLNPQWLLVGGAGQSAQLDLNLSTLVGDAAVVFLEWSGGRSRSLWAQALNTSQAEAFHNRLATGVNYTTANKLTLTLEYDYNGAALQDDAWNSLARGPMLAYQRYRQWTRDNQDMPSQQAVFGYAAWQDALLNHLDLNAMLRVNLADQSRLSWLEARYHFQRADLALQWQVNSGKPGSEYGADPQQRAWQMLWRGYF
jgi:hypothetical protein